MWENTKERILEINQIFPIGESNLFSTSVVTLYFYNYHCTLVDSNCTPGHFDGCSQCLSSVYIDFEVQTWYDEWREGGGSGKTGWGNGTEDSCAGNGVIIINGKPACEGGDDGPLGWEPLPLDEPESYSPLTPCQVADSMAKIIDTITSNSKADSVLSTFGNLDTLSVEKGFPIFKRFSISPTNSADTTFTNSFKINSVFTGTATSINMSYSIPYLHVDAASLHTHPHGGYAAQSADDIYQLIEQRLSNSHYEGTIVAAHDGSQYAITVTDYTKAAAFFTTKGQYFDTDSKGWKEKSEIGKAFDDAKDYFENKVFKDNPNKVNLAYEMAMAVVLNQSPFNAGITLNKKDPATGKFKPIVVNTTIPNPNKPKKKIYSQDCL